METEDESLFQTSGFFLQDIKSTVGIYFEKEIGSQKEKMREKTYLTILQCCSSGAEPSPALLSPGRRGRRSSTQEKKDSTAEKAASEDPALRPQEKRPGETSSTPRLNALTKVLLNQLSHCLKTMLWGKKCYLIDKTPILSSTQGTTWTVQL